MENMDDITLTRQSLPSERYRILLGTAISVFCSNNDFVIENFLRIDSSASWYELIDKTSGAIKNLVRKEMSAEIINLFEELISMRNRIIHGFRITGSCGEQILATKEPSGNQFEITEEYLLKFIRMNDELSEKLHNLRGL